MKEGLAYGKYIGKNIVRLNNGDEITVDKDGWLGDTVCISIVLAGIPFGYVIAGRWREIDPDQALKKASQAQTDLVIPIEINASNITIVAGDLVTTTGYTTQLQAYGKPYDNLIQSTPCNGMETDFGFLDPDTGLPFPDFIILSSNLWMYDTTNPWTVYRPILGVDYNESPFAGTVNFVAAPAGTVSIIASLRRLVTFV